MQFSSKCGAGGRTALEIKTENCGQKPTKLVAILIMEALMQVNISKQIEEIEQRILVF